MCDINPVHYLFATGTAEVSAVCVCANVSVCVGECVYIKHSVESTTCFSGDLVPPRALYAPCCKA